MAYYERLLFYRSGLKIRSRVPEVAIQRREWVPPEGGKRCMYTLNSPVKVEISIDKAKFTFMWERHIHVLNAFSRALEWFFDKNKGDLFCKSEDGTLFFNSDYNNLLEGVSSGPPLYDHLEIRPVIVERDNFKRYEGVIIMIKNSDDYACLTVDELLSVVGVLSSIDFASELMLFMQTAQMTQSFSITDPAAFTRLPDNPNNWNIKGM